MNLPRPGRSGRLGGSPLALLALLGPWLGADAGEARHVEVQAVLGQMYDAVVDADDVETFGLSIPRGTALPRRLYPVRNLGVPMIQRANLKQYQAVLLRRPKRNYTAYLDPDRDDVWFVPPPPQPSSPVVWTNIAGGKWSVAANWSPSQVPGPTDEARITEDGTYTVTVDADAAVAGLTFGGDRGVQTLLLDYPNTLTLNGASVGRTTNGVLRITGGTLAVPENLVLAGPLECINGGRLPGRGTLTLNGGGQIRGPGDTDLVGCTLINAGKLELLGGTLRCRHSFTQTAGETRLAGGYLELDQPLVLQGGALTGNGTVIGSVINRAAVVPGGSPGTLTITGDYTEERDAQLFVELSGTAPGREFDQLVVNGTASLGGTLNVSLPNDFFPPPGSAYAFLLAGTRTGEFARVDPELNTLGLKLDYGRNGATLIATGPAGPPTVTFERWVNGADLIVLAWPESAAGWRLESAPALGGVDGGAWSPIPPVLYQTNVGIVSYAEPIPPAGNRFFRLCQPGQNGVVMDRSVKPVRNDDD